MYHVFCPDCGADITRVERLNDSEELMIAFGKLAEHRMGFGHQKRIFFKKEQSYREKGLETRASAFTIRADDGRLIAGRPGPKKMESKKVSLQRYRDAGF